MLRFPACLALLALVLGGCLSVAPPDPLAADPEALRAETERLRDANTRLTADVARLTADNTRLAGLSSRAAPTCPDPEVVYRGTTVEELTSDLLFETGSANLTPDGLARIDAAAERLRRDFAGKRVRVEGHTDTQPIGPGLRDRFASNWELSTARATTVVRYLQEVHGLDPARIEAVGMGAYSPIAPNGTEDGRSRNRRVRIAALVD